MYHPTIITNIHNELQNKQLELMAPDIRSPSSLLQSQQVKGH